MRQWIRWQFHKPYIGRKRVALDSSRYLYFRLQTLNSFRRNSISCSFLGLEVTPGGTVWQVSLELDLGVIVSADHIESTVLWSSEIRSSDLLGGLDGVTGWDNFFIEGPWVFFLWTIWRWWWSSVEFIDDLGISIRVVGGTLWPDFSPVGWLFLHESWVWDTFKLDGISSDQKGCNQW